MKETASIQKDLMDTTNKKRIMILAGGNDQTALIEELRRFFHGNVEIILLDMSSNVKALPFADKFLQISTMDREAVLQAARKEKIDYILTACGDQPLSTMAYVSHQLKLPCYLSEEDVRNLTNKYFMKKMMIENGIPTAKFICIDSPIDKIDLTGLSFPLIVKPVDSNGSKGVKKVSDKSELGQYLDEAFSYSISKKVIIEEYKEGKELSVDIYVDGDKPKLLCVTTSKKIAQNKESFTIVQSEYPAKVLYSKERVARIAKKIVDAFHLSDTPLLIQMIVNDDEYNVVEFSARMGGGSKYHLIKVLSGVDIMKVYVEMVMGSAPHVEPSEQWKYALMNYVYCHPGTFTRLESFEEVKASGHIMSYFTYKMPYSVITKSTTSSDRVASFLIVGNSEEEIEKKLKYTNEHIKVINDIGEDMMRHDFY